MRTGLNGDDPKEIEDKKIAFVMPFFTGVKWISGDNPGGIEYA
jgi:hypothetical protein